MNTSARPRLLVIGPLPPPIAGTSVSFKIFLDIAAAHPDKLHVSVIDSAPKELGENPLFTTGNFEVARRVLRELLSGARTHSHVLIFSNDRFLLTLASLCIIVCRLSGRPCYVRAFGGSLDSYESELGSLSRGYLRWALRRCDGLLVQTERLRRHFQRLLGDKVVLVPGYRNISDGLEPPAPGRRDGAPLRLVYISHVREEKGIFDVLECLRGLDESERGSIRLHIYGPVYREARHRFELEMSRTDAAEYIGVLDPDDVIGTLAASDVLIFPSYFKGEGHPGILVESMMAGIAVIASDFRSIPELIEDRVNGLLVRPRRPRELLAAVRALRDDLALLETLSRNNWERRVRYSADRLVPKIFESIGIELGESGRPASRIGIRRVSGAKPGATDA